MRLEATRALEEHVLLLWRTGEFFSTFDRPRTPPAVCNQSLDWSKDRPNRGNMNRTNAKGMAVTCIYKSVRNQR